MSTNGDMEIPEFKPSIPPYLLESEACKDPFRRHMLEQDSVQHQKSDWIIRRMIQGDRRFDEIEEDAKETKLANAEKFSEITTNIATMKEEGLITLTPKKLIIGALSVIILPILITVLSEVVKAKVLPEEKAKNKNNENQHTTHAGPRIGN